MSRFFHLTTSRLLLGIGVAATLVSLVAWSPVARAESELELRVNASTIDFKPVNPGSSGDFSVKVATKTFDEGYIEAAGPGGASAYITKSATFTCGTSGQKLRSSNFMIGAFRDSSGKEINLSILAQNNQKLPSGDITVNILTTTAGGNITTECATAWAAVVAGDDDKVTHDREETAKEIVTDERTIAGRRAAGELLAPALETHKQAFIDRSKTRPPAPAGCTTIAGTISCDSAAWDRAWKEFLGKCWIDTNNAIVNSPGVSDVAGAVLTNFSGCISRGTYGNADRQATIRRDLSARGVQYAAVQDAVTKAMQDAQDSLEEDPDSLTGNKSGPSCTIEGIGWLVCPLMKAVAGINDAALGVIKGILTISPSILNTNSGTYAAWDMFRSIANVLFVIVFLVVIFSQVTNLGINNYGIKRLLPRMVIGAILVNVSFYLCQLAVDISNIVGATLGDFLRGATGNIQSAGTPTLGWVDVIVPTLAAAGGAAIAMMAITAPVLIAALVAIVMVVVILIARQAAVILLIAVAPLAFLAWLLPNTEGLFKKWWSMFKGLLLVFPIIALMYGAGDLASNVLLATANEDSSSPDIGLQVAALGVMIIPLGATPFVLRGSLNALGSIGGKLSGMAAGANKKIGQEVGKSRLGDVRRRSEQNAQVRRAKSRAGVYTRRTGGNLNPANWIGRAGARINRETNKLIPSTAGKYEEIATEIEDKEFREGLQRSATAHTASNLSMSERLRMVETGKLNGKTASSTDIAAASSYIMEKGNFDDRSKLYAMTKSIRNNDEYSETDKNRILTTISEGAYAKQDHKVYGGGIGDQIKQAGGGMNESGLLSAAAANAANIDSVTLARDKGTASYVQRAMQQNPTLVGQAARNNIANAASGALNNANLNQNQVDDHKAVLTSLGGTISNTQNTPPVQQQNQTPQQFTPAQTPAGTGGTPQQPTATPNLNNRQAQAQARVNAAAQGTAGTSPFFVAGNGTTASSAAMATGSVKQANASQGSSGSDSRVFVVDRSGDTTEAPVAPPAEPTTVPTVEDSGRQTPGTIGRDDVQDYHDGMSR